MDIKDIKEAKQQCENEISDLLNKFQAKVECLVMGIGLSHNPGIINVEIDLRV